MSYDDFGTGNDDEAVTTHTPETIAACQRVTASFATDADDCRELLLMLGLVEPEECAITPKVDRVSVPNLKAREHIDMLIRDHNANLFRIARAAGLSHVTLAGVMAGTTSYRSTVRAILAVTPEACAKKPRSKHHPTGPRVQQTPVRPVREHAEALRRTMTVTAIATASGVSEDTLRAILHRKRPYVTQATAKAILAISLEVSA